MCLRRAAELSADSQKVTFDFTNVKIDTGFGDLAAP